MSFFSAFRSLFIRRRLDAEMAEEMRFHLEAQEAAYRAAGLSPEEARRAAYHQFGHAEKIQETCRDDRPFAWLEHVIRDLRFGLRMIGKNPGSTAVIVLTLGFGIGVNTTVFGLLSSLFFDPLPVAQANRLVVVAQQFPSITMPVGMSYPDYKDYRARTKTITGLSAINVHPMHVSAEDKAPFRTWGQVVSPGAFTELGVSAFLGRGLLPVDGEAAGGAQVVVLSHSFWKAQFAADPNIVGKSIRINEHPFTVVGVGPPGFRGFAWGLDIVVFVPAGALPILAADGKDHLEKRWSTNWRLVGRLSPGVDFNAARAELDVLSSQVAQDYPEGHRDRKALLFKEQRARPDPSIAGVLPAIGLLFSCLVGLVLLIACANVVNLMMARVLSRRKELVMRSALGATRGRLISQLLSESMLLAALAGIVGGLLARAAWLGLGAFTPNSDIPIYANPETPPGVYFFTGAIAVLVGIITGLIPAWRASRVNLLSGLNEGGGTRVAGEKHRLRDFLVLSQITASCVVLVVAAVFLRSLHAMQTLDFGFRSQGVVLASFNLGLQDYSKEKCRAFHRDLLADIRSLPGIEAASLTQHVPLDVAMSNGELWPENPTLSLKDGKVMVGQNQVDPSYFATMGVALQKGRFFTDADRAGLPLVAVINKTMAETCWPGQEPIGKRFQRWLDGPWVEVIGVTATGKYLMVSEPPRPYAYYSTNQLFATPMTLLVRTQLDPQAALPLIREVIQRLDPHLPIYNTRSLDEHIQGSIFGFMPVRMGSVMAGFQGAIALFLGVIGLYSVVAYGVTQRTREIGVRMALGATRTQVLALVMKDGARLTLIGLGLGLVCAMAFGALASHVLYGAKPFDLPVYLSVALVLGLTAAAACYLPGARAIRINPVTALRHE